MKGGKQWSVCKLRVTGPPPCSLLYVLRCLYYQRLKVEKLALRVVPAFFFPLSLPHRPLYTWPRISLSAAGWMAGRAGERRMRGGRERAVLFHSHLHSGFACLFPTPPAETFQLPEIQVIKLSPEVRLLRLGACSLHVSVSVTYVHTPTHTHKCRPLQGHSGEHRKQVYGLQKWNLSFEIHPVRLELPQGPRTKPLVRAQFPHVSRKNPDASHGVFLYPNLEFDV